MESDQLELLAKTLDDIRHQNGVEYWYARELFPILGYARWDGFESVIARAKEVCLNAGGSVSDHFRHVKKMVKV